LTSTISLPLTSISSALECWAAARPETDVEHRADHLHHVSVAPAIAIRRSCHRHHFIASTPPTISSSSLVMALFGGR
jgi:hypothetical protein